jgi:hypothetical protein
VPPQSCDESWHERFFGLVRPDGSLKPHAEVIRRFTATEPRIQPAQRRVALDVSPDAHSQEPLALPSGSTGFFLKKGAEAMMESLKQKRLRNYSFSLGPLFVVFVTWPWVNALLRAWGYRPYRVWGFALGLGLVLGVVLVAQLIDYALAWGGGGRELRAGLWLGTVIGPYAGLLVADRGANLMWGHAAGIAATLLGFAVGFTAERWLARKRR